MSDFVDQVAEQLGYPAAMVERSARARAQASGLDVDAVLAGWLGGDVPEPSSAAPAPAAPEAAAPAADTPAPPPAATEVEVMEPAVEAASSTADGEPPPDEEAAPATWAGLPRWLAATFMVLPSFALLYALVLPNGPACGDGAVLAVDPVSGEAVGCDGEPYGTDTVDFFSLGQTVYANCAACHGGDGSGGGSFPALAGGAVLETFPGGRCESHVTWVAVGTLGWADATGSDTYGATAKPVGGGGQMPGFGAQLDEETLRAVALYERVAFGGQDLDAGLADCGLGEDAAAAGE